MTGLNAKAVYAHIRELSAEIGEIAADVREIRDAQDSIRTQFRALHLRLDAGDAARTELMAQVNALLAERAVVTAERDAVVLALGFKALKALSAPVMVDRAMVERLIGVVG